MPGDVPIIRLGPDAVAFTTVSYAIGAVFLTVTLLILASRAGVLPAGFPANKMLPILAGILVFTAVNYDVGPYFAARWRSVRAGITDVVSPHAAATPPAAVPAAPRPAVQTASRARVVKRPTAGLRGVVVTRGLASAADEATPINATPLTPLSPDASEQPASTSAADPAPSLAGQPFGTSGHEGHFKRAVKDVSRFLHITR